jgi:hypothetical protein
MLPWHAHPAAYIAFSLAAWTWPVGALLGCKGNVTSLVGCTGAIPARRRRLGPKGDVTVYSNILP